jgi:hypothetical protein
MYTAGMDKLKLDDDDDDDEYFMNPAHVLTHYSFKLFQFRTSICILFFEVASTLRNSY